VETVVAPAAAPAAAPSAAAGAATGGKPSTATKATKVIKGAEKATPAAPRARMQTAPKQKEAAKVFLNTSEDSSKALSAGAVLFGAIEELEEKKLVLTSLQLAGLYGTAGETQVLKRTQRLINQLE
jgi:hypothetical protein